MFRKILVPLDGSELAESVLPHVESIAKSCGVEEVHVVTVVPQITVIYRFTDQRYVEVLDKEVVGKEKAQADSYLAKVAKGLEAKGIKVHASVHVGKAAEEIAMHAEHTGCDLIVIATHGRSGPSRLAYGSVADKVLRTSCVPVMMIRPQACMPKD